MCFTILYAIGVLTRDNDPFIWKRLVKLFLATDISSERVNTTVCSVKSFFRAHIGPPCFDSSQKKELAQHRLSRSILRLPLQTAEGSLRTAGRPASKDSLPAAGRHSQAGFPPAVLGRRKRAGREPNTKRAKKMRRPLPRRCRSRLFRGVRILWMS
jgi:hypothetical protein